MKLNRSLLTLILVWAGWAFILITFQASIGDRLRLAAPDRVLDWTPAETTPGSQSAKPYLNETFLNEQVSWDSEFYLSIATAGYDDPQVAGIWPRFAWGTSTQDYCLPGLNPDCTSLSYAFFPLYPWATRLIAFPLRILPLSRIAAATLAAVIVSLLGSLGAAISLYSMTRRVLGEDGGLRAAFFLLIFPAGFFLAQVYPEGLFLGLTFGALACLLARRWGWAALLACLAVWTRPGGALLLLPMAMVWLKDRSWQEGWKSALVKGAAVVSPAISYGIWSLTPLAARFHFIESHYFSRGLLALEFSLRTWSRAWSALFLGNTQTRFYYLLEFGVIALAITACLLLIREQPEICLFGLAMIFFAITSGPAQGMVRYVMAAPALFWVLARWGRRLVFDRLWTVFSILLLGVESMLFSFDFWVA